MQPALSRERDGGGCGIRITLHKREARVVGRRFARDRDGSFEAWHEVYGCLSRIHRPNEVDDRRHPGNRAHPLGEARTVGDRFGAKLAHKIVVCLGGRADHASAERTGNLHPRRTNPAGRGVYEQHVAFTHS